MSLNLAEKPQVAIVRALQNNNVNQSIVSRTIARYSNTSCVGRREGSGWTKNSNTKKRFRKNA